MDWLKLTFYPKLNDSSLSNGTGSLLDTSHLFHLSALSFIFLMPASAFQKDVKLLFDFRNSTPGVCFLKFESKLSVKGIRLCLLMQQFTICFYLFISLAKRDNHSAEDITCFYFSFSLLSVFYFRFFFLSPKIFLFGASITFHWMVLSFQLVSYCVFVSFVDSWFIWLFVFLFTSFLPFINIFSIYLSLFFNVVFLISFVCLWIFFQVIFSPDLFSFRLFSHINSVQFLTCSVHSRFSFFF